ncbi:class C beta-lactamase-related serine hydrolase [Flavobacteriaceae bacterium AU392]|nr:class C beta-lactamase-related serine hydrolase [Flavobacteriaceae bacterium]RKM81589.1 class C beta-lactamase-related serine hydrolase [Flavobacteriaceae bacterium AU392]
MKRIIELLVILICFQSCGQNKSDRYSASNSKGYYPLELENVYKTARNINNIKSLLVNHNHKLIAEEYFKRYSSDSLDHVRSVTKSVIASLIGIAIDKGIIGGVDESISIYLSETSKEKEAIKIKHLLSMTSGLEWNENGRNSEYNKWVTSNNEFNYVLDKPIIHEPGSVWNYNSGGMHLLSAILTKASGMSTLQFAKKYLFSPIGITDLRWEQHADGFYNGGAGLELKPKDMMKFGELYINKGKFNRKRIISERFIKDATKQQQPPNLFGSNEGYGYGWWIGEGNGVSGFMAQGYGGQTILIVPKQKIIIVTTYNWRVNSQIAGEQQEGAIKIISGSVIDNILKS